MTERNLLEDAAKAAGMRIRIYEGMQVFPGTDLVVTDAASGFRWNPLIDDGDALRLAVRLDLGIEVHCSLAVVHVGNGEQERESVHWNLRDVPDAYTATRLAIVRAAAKLARRRVPQVP